MGARRHDPLVCPTYIVTVLYNMYSGYVHMHMYTHHTRYTARLHVSRKANWEDILKCRKGNTLNPHTPHLKNSGWVQSTLKNYMYMYTHKSTSLTLVGGL